MATIQLLTAVTATNGAPTAVKATGSITTVAKASIINGETVTIGDARGKSLVFVFDATGTYTAAAGRWRVNISASTTADDVRDVLISAVNASGIEVTATSGGAATVTLTQNWCGTEGNMTILETVADGGFAVSGFTGGALSGVALDGLRYGRGDKDEGKVTAMVASTAGSGVMTVTIRVWVFSHVAAAWMPLGSGADATKGTLNAGTATGEVSADKVAHTEILDGVSAFDRVYFEVAAIGGAATAISAWIASRRVF